MILATIEVNRLRIFAHIGVMEQERLVGNEFEVTLHVTCPVDDAAVNDRLDGSVSYADLTSLIRREMSRECQLLEHAAWRIAEAVRREFPTVRGGRIRVAKLTPPLGEQMASAAVVLEF